MTDSVIMSTIDRPAHTVLVVDDNPATRYSTARVIRAAGFQTLEAGTGEEALELAPTGVSAVVLDVNLPGIDGFEVSRLLRERPATQRLPIVHLSATLVKNEDHVAGLNAGADGYLIHPVEPAVLVATLQALIRARTAEDQLRRSEQRFRAIYDQAQSAIALLDAKGRFVDANPALLQLLQCSHPELVGKHLTAVVTPSWKAFVEDQVLRSATEVWRGEFPLVACDGRSPHLEWRLAPHGEPGLRILVGLDISERHELEQRRRELLEREQAARASAERHSRTKDDFIAVLSHELRTPLNAIVGWLHILKRRGVAPEGMRGLEAIERNVQTQARIISDILDVSRINSGKLQLERQWLDPAELVRSSIAALGLVLDEKKIKLETDIGGASAPAWLDPARYQQILWNLLTNAIKFSDTGGEIRVKLAREDDRLVLTVRDFGQGIAPDFLAHLFDRFTQSDAPGNRRHGGLGLGLSIVKHLVDLHGGEVSAHSEGPGHGTLMRVELPAVSAMAASESAPADEGAEDEPDPSATALQGLSILVVEDDREASEMMNLVLSERGARVSVARDYDSALKALGQSWPQALVSDIGLPGRDGYELLRQVRKLQKERGLPLSAIALTAFARPEDVRKASEVGFDLHLSKPVRPHRLIAAIASLMQEAAQARR